MNDGGYKSDLSINERVMIAIVRAAELFRKENDALFKNYGLTFPQYNVLRVLDASANGQNTLTSIGRIMLVSGANMTGIAKRLEKKGFLIRKSDPNDERIKLLEITPKGKQTLKNISPEKDENLKSFLVSFSDDEKAHMLTGLKRILKKETHSS
jgi:DNA-binding MarR family transcriptional regulator